VSDADWFDVEAEARTLAGVCQYTPSGTRAADEEAHAIKVRKREEALNRAIAHGRRLGAEEMRERAAQACEEWSLRMLPRPEHMTRHAEGIEYAAWAVGADIRALPLPGDE
jgi:hypothetical protein